MQLDSRKNANHFYQLISNAIDEYFRWNVSPVSLKKYLSNKKNLNNFIDSNNLKEVKNIKTVIKDVLDDRIALMGIQKFESFNKEIILENSYRTNKITENLGEINEEEYQKVISVVFKVELSDVKMIDGKNRAFSVVDAWSTEEDPLQVFIFNSEDLAIIKSNVLNALKNDIKSEYIDTLYDTSIKIENLIPEEILTKRLFDFIDNDKIKYAIEDEVFVSFEKTYKDFWLFVG